MYVSAETVRISFAMMDVKDSRRLSREKDWGGSFIIVEDARYMLLGGY